ncbi:MAG: hypothetical protein JWO82_2553 [Akkermansiaceae bacterium]|nr:hypothetical protein [Akkermansiaceae bacterium]
MSEDFFEALPSPDAIGSAEYRAILETLTAAAGDPEHAAAICDEYAQWGHGSPGKSGNGTATMNPLGESLCNIRCRCGHEGDFMDFCRRPVSGDLPPGQYQCPVCHRAWTYRPTGPPHIGWSGLVIPAPVAEVELPPLL